MAKRLFGPGAAGDEESRIEKLGTKLYARKGSQTLKNERHRLAQDEFAAESVWQHDADELEEIPTGSRGKHPGFSSVVKTFFVFSAIFFVGASIIAAWLFFDGRNVVSSKNIDISVAGPVVVQAGDEAPLQIAVSNANPTALDSVSLVVRFPSGTRQGNGGAEYDRERIDIGTLRPGEVIQEIVRPVFFGEENAERVVSMTLEYRVAGSNALLTKEKEYVVRVGSSPVRLVVSSGREVNAGQDTTITLEVQSNSDNTLSNVLVTAAYPFGFTFKNAQPSPAAQKTVWRIGELAPGATHKITITGVLDGQDGEARIFRFEVGIQEDPRSETIETPVASTLQTIAIAKPFLGVRVVVNNESGREFTARAGKSVRVDVEWVNNLPTSIIDAEIQVHLDTKFINRSSVAATSGFYDSSEETIRWNEQTSPQLANIAPGQSGSVRFSFDSFAPGSGGLAGALDPVIRFDVSVSGRRTSESGVPERIVSTSDAEILLQPDVQVSSRSLYFAGPLENTGPIPPRAEQETTYTIVWSVVNSTSDVTDALVTATLPAYVRWAGVVEPGSETVRYLPVGEQIVWDLGDVRAHTGAQSAPREVAFQVILKPSVSQIGSSLELVSDATFSGRDRFTGEAVRAGAQDVGTRLVTDPEFKTGQDTVKE